MRTTVYETSLLVTLSGIEMISVISEPEVTSTTFSSVLSTSLYAMPSTMKVAFKPVTINELTLELKYFSLTATAFTVKLRLSVKGSV